MLDDILNRGFLHNRVSAWLLCLAILAGGFLAVNLVKSFVTRRLRARARTTPTRLDDFLVERIRKTGVPLAYLGIVETSLRALELSPRADRAIDIAGIVLMAIFFIQFTVALVRFAAEEYVSKQGEDSSRDRVLKALSALLNALVWVLGILFMLDNLGFRISTVVAGLGIGGIAVALAAQAILGDLFAYFTILFDRPFEVGDYIVVGEHQGTIDRFGIKTTRISGLGGEQIIVANKDLTDSRVRNFGRMTRRRVSFQVGVSFQTGAEKLREIPGMISAIFREIEGPTLDRVHFSSYGQFGPIYEIVYFVESADYMKYMDIQQAANLRIFEEFRKSGIDFGQPGQPVPPLAAQ